MSSTDQIFEEVDGLKLDLKNNVFLLQEKLKDLTKEVGTTTTLVINSIPGMAVMVAPPTFNVPGAITVLMLGLNSLSGIQTKVKEITPLLSTIQKANYIVRPDKMEPLTKFFNTTLTGLNAISGTINGLQLISKSKLDSLEVSKRKIEEVDKEINNLKPEQFDKTSDFENRKRLLNTRKETLSKQAENTLKS
jgi:hypothetical protein